MGCVTRLRWLAVVSLAALASCALTPPHEAARESGVQAPVHAGAYQIDPATTTLHILVYRGDSMAKLGHNHVISSRNVCGGIGRGASLESSGFDIAVPVNDLIVDDAAARVAEGEDFSQIVNEEAKEGTKANMLRELLLDGARFPDIRIGSVSLQGDTNAPTVVAAIRIKDQIRHVTLPVTVHSTDSGMRVQGAFEIKQTDFGIIPISVALGALQVIATIKIKFDLIANYN